MTAWPDLIRSLDIQAAACAALGSPFSAALLAKVSADAAAGGGALGLFAPWAGAGTRTLLESAVALRLLGALHDEVLARPDGALAAAYPAQERAGEADAAWRAASASIDADGPRIAAFMAHEPQTNEVRRSACLLPGFLTVAAETGLPLRCFEVGASAGLNQLWDRYRYRLGEAATWGAADSPVEIPAEWRGPLPPLEAPIEVIARGACDRKPVDLTDAAARRRLRAYVWPDQFDRLERLDAAVAMALAAGTRVEAEDAVSWARRRAAPEAGAVTVLYHSVFWQYMPAESQTALAAVIAAHGAAARAEAPFAWLRMEPDPDNSAVMQTRLTLWPGGETRALAAVHPRGAWVEWAGNDRRTP